MGCVGAVLFAGQAVVAQAFIKPMCLGEPRIRIKHHPIRAEPFGGFFGQRAQFCTEALAARVLGDVQLVNACEARRIGWCDGAGGDDAVISFGHPKRAAQFGESAGRCL